ncbi:MAG TPA: UDP-2,3-diacylglucosamine diphosphatase LpxI [Verrucomicrobiae bacterium]|nr:UDP-2,3-diacylglucosamine diphosphatase LpxI [Verrucomicrobiae bacterium]
MPNWEQSRAGMDALGIIAGNGEFPLVLARAARLQGVGQLVAVAFEGETEPEVATLVDEVEWIKIGQLNKLIQAFTSRAVNRAVMAGGIAPANLFKNLSLDFRMITVAARLKVRNAESIFGAIADELAKDGVALLDPRQFLGDAVPREGCLTRVKPTKQQKEDIEFGLRTAKEVSRLDIGQTVVVKEGTVLAVEGFEGTDECIRRGGALAGEKGGAVVVKVSKPNQDFRFDIPCIGRRTLESCATGKIAVLAIEAGSSLLLGKDEIVRTADKQDLRIVGVTARE